MGRVRVRASKKAESDEESAALEAKRRRLRAKLLETRESESSESESESSESESESTDSSDDDDSSSSESESSDEPKKRKRKKGDKKKRKKKREEKAKRKKHKRRKKAKRNAEGVGVAASSEIDVRALASKAHKMKSVCLEKRPEVEEYEEAVVRKHKKRVYEERPEVVKERTAVERPRTTVGVEPEAFAEKADERSRAKRGHRSEKVYVEHDGYGKSSDDRIQKRAVKDFDKGGDSRRYQPENDNRNYNKYDKNYDDNYERNDDHRGRTRDAENPRYRKYEDQNQTFEKGYDRPSYKRNFQNNYQRRDESYNQPPPSHGQRRDENYSRHDKGFVPRHNEYRGPREYPEDNPEFRQPPQKRKYTDERYGEDRGGPSKREYNPDNFNRNGRAQRSPNRERERFPPRDDNQHSSNPRKDSEPYHRRKFGSKDREWNKKDTYEWGKKEQSTGKAADDKAQKEKPNFALSGKLTEDTNMVGDVVVKYSEPPEGRKPKRRWRFYPFKGDKALPILYIHRQSYFLLGRERAIADIPLDHPSISKQHAVLQYRLVPFRRDDGSMGKRVRPYIIDLGSSNGTFVNNNQIEPSKYVELLERDVIKFGFSQREYVLLHENSKEEELEDDDDDVKPTIKSEDTKVKIKSEPQD